MEIFFIIFAAMAIASALGVVLFPNPINSALCLILNLLTVAAIYAQLEAHFLAAVQVIVYAGAIMVLVIFVLMLLNTKQEKPNTLSKVGLVVAFFSGAGFLVGVLPAVFAAYPNAPGASIRIVGSVKAMGELIYTQYVFPFEAASLLIMAAMVGAIMLAKRSLPAKEFSSQALGAAGASKSGAYVLAPGAQ